MANTNVEKIKTPDSKEHGKPEKLNLEPESFKEVVGKQGEKVEGQINKLKQKGDEFEKVLKAGGADEDEVTEFKEGRGKIGKEADEAKKEYNNPYRKEGGGKFVSQFSSDLEIGRKLQGEVPEVKRQKVEEKKGISEKLEETKSRIDGLSQFVDTKFLRDLYQIAEFQLRDKKNYLTAEKLNNTILEMANPDNEKVFQRMRKIKEIESSDMRFPDSEAPGKEEKLEPISISKKFKELVKEIEGAKGIDTEIPRFLFNKAAESINQKDLESAVYLLIGARKILEDRRSRELAIVGFSSSRKLLKVEGLEETEKTTDVKKMVSDDEKNVGEKKPNADITAKKAETKEDLSQISEKLNKELEERIKVLEQNKKDLQDEESKLSEEKTKELKKAKWNPFTAIKARDYEYWSAYTSKVDPPTKRIGEIDDRMSRISTEKSKIYKEIEEIEKKLGEGRDSDEDKEGGKKKGAGGSVVEGGFYYPDL
ncbi:hypothetical protein KJ636_01820 [Patescibacteria group bacterium]|nr:hypothetical protein [Patescibacteria group bacterium]MBU4480890.1 hypothetical protein [Patescibacteria group bacterium]